MSGLARYLSLVLALPCVLSAQSDLATVTGIVTDSAHAVAPDVRSAGGEWVEVPMDGAHVDGSLVTAPAWPAHPAWLARFLELLGTRVEP